MHVVKRALCVRGNQNPLPSLTNWPPWCEVTNGKGTPSPEGTVWVLPFFCFPDCLVMGSPTDEVKQTDQINLFKIFNSETKITTLLQITATETKP